MQKRFVEFFTDRFLSKKDTQLSLLFLLRLKKISPNKFLWLKN